ncbi:MAG: helix-turn-helix domain-containing protein [Asticcacaulis sp.]
MCPINITLEAIGDAWSMLIIRDLMLRGHNSYQGFLRSGEKIATNILADRLLKLEQNGLISKSPDPADKRKFIYALTSRGADLAPILVEMALYGLKYEPLSDMAKEVALDMQRNKQVFAQRLTRHFTPKVRGTAKKKAEGNPEEETLSLF